MVDRRRGSSGQEQADARHGSAARASPEPTHERLIEAARRVFARDGYEGASIRSITREAEANLGAITYHFGTKEKLYEEVLKRVLTPLRDRIVEVCQSQTSAEQRIRDFFHAAFTHLMDNPDQARFMVEIRLGYGPVPPAALKLMEETGRAVASVIQEGQAEGLIRPGLPVFYVMSLMAQPVFIMLTTHRAPADALPEDPHSTEGRAALLEHMVGFALHGLTPEKPTA
jgi:AcrR family transcriptional regulator